jgi:hypothetical protein
MPPDFIIVPDRAQYIQHVKVGQHGANATAMD